jgi:hypothetical protein
MDESEVNEVPVGDPPAQDLPIEAEARAAVSEPDEAPVGRTATDQQIAAMTEAAAGNPDREAAAAKHAAAHDA